MKRMHIHLGVEDLASSVKFYTSLFGVTPTVLEADYAKWALEDPRVNFAISNRCESRVGVDHLGIQCEDKASLTEQATRLSDAGQPVVHQESTVCCYATGQKVWVSDPQGIPWETFVSEGSSTEFGENFDRDLLNDNRTSVGKQEKCC